MMLIFGILEIVYGIILIYEHDPFGVVPLLTGVILALLSGQHEERLCESE